MEHLSGKGGAAYIASRNKDGGCKRTDYSMPTMKKLSPMNKAEMKTVKHSEAKETATKDRELAANKKESAMYGMKTSKKLGGK